MREKHHSDGRQFRTFRQLSLREEAEQMAENQIRTYMLGEPSTAFFPSGLDFDSADFDTSGHNIVFQAQKTLEPARKGDRAKRRADVINTLLEHPQEFQVSSPSSTEGLIRRQFDRILRFARTLRNKGRLHPQIDEILNP